MLRAGFMATIAVIALMDLYRTDNNDKSIALHSEWDPTDKEDNFSWYYSEDSLLEEQDAQEHWLTAELRYLKRGGSSSSSSRSSSSRGSYGNCYGDRCDDTGGSADVAIIIGSIVGGCCVLLCIYMLIVYC